MQLSVDDHRLKKSVGSVALGRVESRNAGPQWTVDRRRGERYGRVAVEHEVWPFAAVERAFCAVGERNVGPGIGASAQIR